MSNLLPFILIFSVVVIALVLLVFLTLTTGKNVSLRLGSLKFMTEGDASVIRESLERAGHSTEDRQFALVKEYHSRGLAQSRQSFWFSIGAATLGFLVIIGSLILQVFSPSPDLGIPIVQAVSGTVLEAVAGLFFVQSNKARELLIEFFDKLREDRKLDESLTLVRQMADGDLKARLQFTLSATFSGSIDQPTVLGLLNSSTPATARGNGVATPPSLHNPSTFVEN